MRAPLVAGLDDRVGTSTVAAALHARDGGRCQRGADVIVCDGRSLRLAGALEFPPSGPRPVLAIALVPGVPTPQLPRLRALDARFGALVLVPYVESWQGDAPGRGNDDPLASSLSEAAAVLGYPAEQLPRPLRSYAAAIRTIAAAVLRSGQLHRPTPPLARTRTVRLWHGLLPVERPTPPRPVLVAVPPPARLRRADGPGPLVPVHDRTDDEALDAPAEHLTPRAGERAG